jgi:hypothetical protein
LTPQIRIHPNSLSDLPEQNVLEPKKHATEQKSSTPEQQKFWLGSGTISSVLGTKCSGTSKKFGLWNKKVTASEQEGSGSGTKSYVSRTKSSGFRIKKLRAIKRKV